MNDSPIDSNDETKAKWPKDAHPMLAALAADPEVTAILTQGLLEPVEKPRFEIAINGVTQEPGAIKHVLVKCFYVAGGKKNFIGAIEYGKMPNPDNLPPEKNPPDTVRITGPGGAVSVPFAIMNGQLVVGLISERRVLDFDPVAHPNAMSLGTPRGYVAKPGASANDAARTELAEEFAKGLPTLEPKMAGGEPINQDNAWFDFARQADGTQGGGVQVCLFEVEERLLVDDGQGTYRLNQEYPREAGSPWEKIDRCRFYPWTIAVQQRDGMTSLGVARLLAELAAAGRMPGSFAPPATPA